MKYDYLIVGSGLFGSVFARKATDKGKKCLVLERRTHTGGNVYCETVEGINVQKYGPHIFHTSNQKVWNYVNRFAEFNNFVHSPLANYRGEIFNLPFNMNTFCKMWGVYTPTEAERIIEKQRANVKGDPQNLEEQAIQLVGQDIFEKLIKGYTEKQWGRDCKDLPAFIILRLPVRFTYDNNYFIDLYQGIPHGGYNRLIANLLQGVEVLTEVDYNTNRAAYEPLAETVIYTGQVDEFYGFKYGALEYRSLRFEDELFNIDNYQGVAVVNYTDRQVPYTRIVEHKHFEFGKQHNTVITREYPLDWKMGMEPYYPVNDEKNQLLYQKYKTDCNTEKKTIFGGRLAEYRYYDMDKVIERALVTANCLL